MQVLCFERPAEVVMTNELYRIRWDYLPEFGKQLNIVRAGSFAASAELLGKECNQETEGNDPWLPARLTREPSY